MPNYSYKARDESGRLIRGEMKAASKEELAGKLRNMRYTPTLISESRGGFNIAAMANRLKTVSPDDIIIFDLQLASMVSSGLTILASLDTLAKQTENRIFREILEDVARGVESGSTLSDSFAKHPQVFSRLFVSMIRSGEASGKLDTILTRWAAFAEREHDMRQNVSNALFYPAILFVAGVLVILFIVTFIIPQFVTIFEEVNLRLPLPTVILSVAGGAIKRYWYMALGVLIAAALGMKAYTRKEEGRLKFDSLVLSLPAIGPLARKVAVSRFARTLGTLVGSGVPILQSLDIARDVTGNAVLSRVVAHARSGVEKGQKIGESLMVSDEFPADAIQMISVGEETGNLDGMLNKISDLYDTTINYTIKKLTVIIEPAFLVVMGIIVAFIMASMLLPIFDMVKMLRH